MNTEKHQISNLKQLISSLKTFEIKLIKKSLSQSKIPENSKQLLLFNLLLTEKAKNFEEVQKHLFKKNESVSQKTFNKICERLKNKILDQIISDENFSFKNSFSEPFKNRHEINKQILLAKIFLGRGLEKDLSNTLEKILRKAKKFEFYNEFLDALYLKQMFLGVRQGISVYREIDKEILHFESCRSLFLKTRNLQQSFMNMGDFKGTISSKPKPELKLILNYENKCRELSSNTSLYFILILKAYFYELNVDYIQTSIILEELLILVKNQVSLFEPRRLGTLYNNMAETDIQLNKFSLALKNIANAKIHLNKNSFNYVHSKGIQFHAEFYQGNFKNSLTIINEILENKLISNFNKSKFNYLRSCNLFIQNEFRINFLDLQLDYRQIEDDKEGWNVGVRIFEILCLIEKKEAEQIVSRLFSLKKHILRMDKIYKLSKRDSIILKIIQELVKQNFSFKMVASIFKKELLDLSGNEKTCDWKAFTPEVIPFHHWFYAKLKGDKLDFQKLFQIKLKF